MREDPRKQKPFRTQVCLVPLKIRLSLKHLHTGEDGTNSRCREVMPHWCNCSQTRHLAVSCPFLILVTCLTRNTVFLLKTQPQYVEAVMPVAEERGVKASWGQSASGLAIFRSSELRQRDLLVCQVPPSQCRAGAGICLAELPVGSHTSRTAIPTSLIQPLTSLHRAG